VLLRYCSPNSYNALRIRFCNSLHGTCENKPLLSSGIAPQVKDFPYPLCRLRPGTLDCSKLLGGCGSSAVRRPEGVQTSKGCNRAGGCLSIIDKDRRISLCELRW